jgi:hypothetical protein
MPEPKMFPVYDETGRIGSLLSPARFLDSRAEKTIRLDNGQEITVPSAALKVQPDGSFRLLRTETESAAPSPLGAPAAESSEASPEVLEPDQLRNAGFFQDEYDIEHVPVGRILDALVTQRQEGDTLILPVVEEVLVYRRKLYLREEIRITRRKKPVDEVRRIEHQ